MPIDYSEYGIEFIVKSRILRGYGRCARCSARQGRKTEETGAVVVLTVHHLDGDKKNNELFNLVPLCQKCHLFAHRGKGESFTYRDMRRDYHKWIDVLLRFIEYVIPENKNSRKEEKGVGNAEE